MSEYNVPEGWKLVPEEPTPQMLDEIHLVSEFTGKALTTRYRAMLAAAPAAPAQAEQEPVAWMTHHDEPMFFSAEKEAAAYCDNDESPIPLYAAPPAHPDAALVEALEHARQFIRNGIDLGFIRMPDADAPDPAHETLPKIDAALSTYRAALAGKGGE